MLYLGGDDYHPLQHNSYQNMTVEEVAQALNTSPATISRRLNAARTKLRNLLEGGNAYEG